MTNHVIRKLIKDGILPADQVVNGASYQIKAEDLRSEQVKQALARKVHPCRTAPDSQMSMFTITYEGVHDNHRALNLGHDSRSGISHHHCVQIRKITKT